MRSAIVWLALGRSRDGGPEGFEVLVGNVVKVALEGQLPVLSRPLLDIGEPRTDRVRGDPLRLVEHDVGGDLHPPGIVLARFRLPDDLMVLVAVALDPGRGPEGLRLRHVVDEVVAGAHLLEHLASLARLEALDRESQVSGPPEVVRRTDHHPAAHASAGRVRRTTARSRRTSWCWGC